MSEASRLKGAPGRQAARIARLSGRNGQAERTVRRAANPPASPAGGPAASPADSPSRSADHSAPPARPSPLFTLLYEQHNRPLLRLAALLTGDQAAAEFVVADVFVSLQRVWRAAGSGDRAVGYLLRLVVLRSRRTVRKSRLPRTEPAGDPRTRGAEDAVVIWPSPEVVAALRALPLRQREAVVLSYCPEFTAEQAAVALGVRQAALRRLQAEGLTALHDNKLP